MQHEDFNNLYSEIMYKERDIIKKFLKDQYDIRYGRQRDTWHFDNAVELVAHQGSHVLLQDIKLDKDKVVVFYVDAFGDKDAEWECFDFAYGELSKIIEALPDANQILTKNAVSDIALLCMECSVNLEENPFVTKINGKDVSIYEVQYEDGRVISYEKQGRIVNDEYESDFLVGLRDHINIEVLHRSNEYKELMELLSLEENMMLVCQDFGDAEFEIDGTDMTVDVAAVQRDDKGNLVIYGGDLDADENITLTEKEIKPQYLMSIIEFMKPKYTDIMDTHNGHNAELVRKINAAWNIKKYKELLPDILFAIVKRDFDMYTEADFFGEQIEDKADTLWYANKILEEHCDDKDLKAILYFIRYEE